MAKTVVRLNKTAIKALLRGPDGPIIRYMFNDTCRKVVFEARKRIRRSKGDGPHLKDSLVREVVGTPQGASVAVIMRHPRGALYLFGSVRHPIEVNHHYQGADGTIYPGYLKFKGKNGKYIFRVIVDHPGTKPRPVLQEAAVAVGLRLERVRIVGH